MWGRKVILKQFNIRQATLQNVEKNKSYEDFLKALLYMICCNNLLLGLILDLSLPSLDADLLVLYELGDNSTVRMDSMRLMGEKYESICTLTSIVYRLD